MVTKTPAGNPVALFQDEQGNIFMIDPNGNLYYDTGDPKLGVYFVRHLAIFPRSKRCIDTANGRELLG